jgi:7-cyano-7-deazaguanine synthase
MGRHKEAVCIVSGGLDSICAMAYLIETEGYRVHMITFGYGQRAKREIRAAKKFAKNLRIQDHKVVDISFLKAIYGKTNALTNTYLSLPKHFDYTIVVPLRNAVFITIAGAWAMSIGAGLVAYGAHIGDERYPDCRPEFVKSITNALNLGESDGIESGLRKNIKIWCPAIDGIEKSDLLKIGYRILGNQIFQTWSCYTNGIVEKSKDPLHCGKCESCINRKEAISKAGLEDKTHYAN